MLGYLITRDTHSLTHSLARLLSVSLSAAGTCVGVYVHCSSYNVHKTTLEILPRLVIEAVCSHKRMLGCYGIIIVVRVLIRTNN